MTYKTVFRTLAALAIALALATGAEAFNFAVGDNVGKMTDWTSFFLPLDGQGNYDPDGDWTPLPESGGPAPGESLDDFQTRLRDTLVDKAETRAIYRVDTLALGDDAAYYVGSSPYLSGLIGDLMVTNVNVLERTVGGTLEGYRTEYFFGPGGRFSEDANSPYQGGRFDMVSTSVALDRGDPADYGEATALTGTWWDDPFAAGRHDTFPTITDGAFSPVLTGTFLPRGDGSHFQVLLDFDTNWVLQEGSSKFGYLELVANYTGTPFLRQQFDGTGPEADARIKVTYGPSPQSNWLLRSDDPIDFTALPEPGSIALLGMGIASLSGVAIKRRRKS